MNIFAIQGVPVWKYTGTGIPARAWTVETEEAVVRADTVLISVTVVIIVRHS